jgi:hypothetical protein
VRVGKISSCDLIMNEGNVLQVGAGDGADA